MSGYTGWAAELPAIHHNASFEIEDVKPAKVALDKRRTLRQRFAPHCR
jgi:hypothetical protein